MKETIDFIYTATVYAINKKRPGSSGRFSTNKQTKFQKT